MTIRSNVLTKRVPMDGRDLNEAIIQECANQAARNPDPRKLVAAFPVQTSDSLVEVILVFELAQQ